MIEHLINAFAVLGALITLFVLIAFSLLLLQETYHWLQRRKERRTWTPSTRWFERTANRKR